MPGTEHAISQTGTSQSDDDSPLARAETRMAQAIGRLEAALDALPEGGGDAAPDPELAAEVERLTSENGELRALVGEAAGQLDDAIDRLKRRAGA